MSIRRDILPEHNWVAGEDKVFTYILYVPGTTDEQIAFDPNANRLDIGGFELLCEIHHSRHHNRPPVLQKYTTTNDITTVPEEGLAFVNFYAGDTQGLDEGWYWHTLWKINDGAKVQLSYGKAFLRNPAWS